MNIAMKSRLSLHKPAYTYQHIPHTSDVSYRDAQFIIVSSLMSIIWTDGLEEIRNVKRARSNSSHAALHLITILQLQLTLYIHYFS